MRTAIAFLVAAMSVANARADGALSQADLYRRLIDLDRLADPPAEGERTVLFSSFDRASMRVEDGRYVNWDADNDRGQFVRQDGEWSVMAEIDGAGYVARFWVDAPAGDLRVWVDGRQVIDAEMKLFVDGGVAPFGQPLTYETTEAGGWVNLSPIGYAKSLRIACRGFDGRYQIDCRQVAKGQSVEPFGGKLDDAARKALRDVTEAMQLGLSQDAIFGERHTIAYSNKQDLAAGAKLSEDIKGQGTIRGLFVGLTDRRNPRQVFALRKCVIRIFFDGRAEPYVEAPLVDFFGSGFELRSTRGIPVGTDYDLRMPLPDRKPGDDRFMYCLFPMPFANGARIEIENLNEGREAIGLLTYVRFDREGKPGDRLRFHARFNSEAPCQSFDYPILTAIGRGRLVGCTLSVDCPRAEWWGRGDHKVWVDDDTFPAIYGTGTADFVDDTPPLHAHSEAFSGAPLVNAFGKQSVYRWFVADDVPFQRGLAITIENWQDNGLKDVDYSSVAYWYATPDSTARFDAIDREMVTPNGLRIPFAVEAETALQAGAGTITPQRETLYSGEAAVGLKENTPTRFRITTPVGKVRLGVRVHPRRGFETLTLTDDKGGTIGVVTYANGTANGLYTVAEWAPGAGEHEIVLTASRTMIVDCFTVEPVEAP
ncbi:MAG: DUF2961 domain-containing protein [Phycisphaerales bacterium]|nr:DUF2961 domain-containing protein [Phycisphaerales bacterium]